MQCVKSLLNKNVINIKTGQSLGCVKDVLIDTSCGVVSKIVIPQKNNVLSLFNNENNYISWCDVVKVGEDLILVDCNIFRKKD